MSGKAIATGKGYYIWEGGPPTAQEMRDAPMLTVFPGTSESVSPDPSRPRMLPDGPDVEEDEPKWFSADIGDSDYLLDDAMRPRLRAMGIEPDGYFEHQANNEFYFPGDYDDEEATVDGIAAGWTVVKLPVVGPEPDAGDRYYILDSIVVKRDGEGVPQALWHESVRHRFVSGAPRPRSSRSGSGDIETINRHRASMGRDPIDPGAGWTAAELADMAENIRKTGREFNPRQTELKRKLMR